MSLAQAAKRARSGSSGDGESSEPAAAEFAPSGVFAEEGLGREGGADGEGAGAGARGKGKGKGGGAPRPPQLLRRHEPCTDTTPMDTEAFLAHLQKLSWYKVRRTCCDAVLSLFAQPACVFCQRMGESVWECACKMLQSGSETVGLLKCPLQSLNVRIRNKRECRTSWRTARGRLRGGRASLTRRSRCPRRPAPPWPRAALGAYSCIRCVLWSCLMLCPVKVEPPGH